jgi:hypothetical protein
MNRFGWAEGGIILRFFKKVKTVSRLPKAPEWAENHPAWLRLEDQLGFYDSKSVSCQGWYKRLKIYQVLLAVAIPIFSHLDPEVAKWTTSISGALIALLEGIQHMNQYSTLWVTYRSTAEYLKHEKYLFLSAAAVYYGIPNEDRLVLLAERVEERVSTEHANWFNEICRVTNDKKGGSDG